MGYCMGIDGGGTKTICLLSETNGKIVGRGMAGPSNYHIVGEEQAVQALRACMRQAIAESGQEISELRCITLGMAGVDRPADRLVMQRILSTIGMRAQAHIFENDAAIALTGASLFNPGVIVICGTGSIAFGVNAQGERQRAGGWGPLLGDEGSGYDIGRRALMAVVRAADGRAPDTRLQADLLEHLGVRNAEELVERVYGQRLQRHEIAELAPLVIAAAQTGDQAALSILTEAGHELALAAGAVVSGLGMQADAFDLSLSGGVLRASKHLAETIGQQIRLIAPKARIITPRFSPVVGALLLALRQANGCIADTVLNQIAEGS